ncbi:MULTISPECIES: YceI family protein [unclassified Streptomyces]|uniref:YceI family protein n=1 Tax=unclassified Streptomyces TaxID=2593676 RepID=UPI002254BAC7|nr:MULTISPECIES: YceI family protein [unclassified Streptomyces]WSP56345.1 YceI family protein [Streptomyces sp. NBC_01241]WSU22938.1 YceI family protein [Streptomyces sp. NBC_01108]MCX4788070.1 YceI family protein [Streptomyces sp. NBC_01221]MCX4796169.1 YceI family protein [Streptomyces sp. NBC_01242]WSJ37423.1 YceI family protein [Streptomyces sp. NBC_01321]
MGLRAQVRTRDGWAVQHAVVTVTDMTGTQVLRAAADEDGAVRTDTPLQAGAYTVIVTAVGYAPAASTALVTASGRVEAGTVVLARQGGVELPPPGAWSLDPAHCSVAAVAQHLGISSVRGRFTEFNGRIEIAEDVAQSRVDAVISAASIDTGNGMRDKHLRSPDFLDSDRFPEITYRSNGLTPAGPDRWLVHGELTMRGVVRPVDLDLSYLGTGPDPWGGVRAAFSATAELRREDFAMNYNQVVQAGISAIGTTLRVELDIQAVQGESLPS